MEADERPHTSSVILTKVRTQGYGRWRLWLWVLTFVRMTGGMVQAAGLSSVVLPLGQRLG
ncbi:hypothetical protein EV283_2741 [Sphingomonas sp. BK036]|nr:hypothetical protein EV283_2741 [Sphingomonas sp. BK036]